MRLQAEDIVVSKKRFIHLFAIAGLLGIAVSLSVGNFIIFAAILSIPISVIVLCEILVNPRLLLYGIFIVNYFIMGLMKYVSVDGISFLMDILLMSEILIIFLNSAIRQNINWKDAVNTLTIVSFVWLLYCLLEIFNPSGVLEAWILSRSLFYFGLFTAIIISLIITDFKQVKSILNFFAVLTVLAVIKALIQKIFGFDASEMKWLIESKSITTHILGTGVIRYFSFFTDAGNFGSNMGAAGIIFILAGIFSKQKFTKISYIIVGIAALYAMLISGTRGAMIVPLGGLALYVVLSKNVRAMAIGSTALIFIYIFFAFTYIGEGNSQISRMRTAFHPSDDPSYLVRKNNKRMIGEYLKNKPFGEGLGLGGVETSRFGYRLTSQIPHDSWYVKLWMETGVVGLSLYILGFVIVYLNCMYVLMFKVRNKEVKGLLSAMLCGVLGLLLSAYGNAFFGQFPTTIMSYAFLAIVLKGESLDKRYSENQLLTNEQTNKKIRE